MEPATERKFVLVTRKTRLEELIVRYNTVEQAKFVIESQGIDFSDYLLEHERYSESRRLVEEAIERNGRIQIVERSFLPNFLFGTGDIIVVLGQDGLVANTLKYLEGQPLVGVNPDALRWDGILLPFQPRDLLSILPEVAGERRTIKEVTMAKATLNDGQSIVGVNDLFIGPNTHFSARYEIAIGGKSERHSSSGIIVSTGLGSTGWLSSLFAGAMGIAATIRGRPLPQGYTSRFDWSSSFLRYTVREPFPSNVTGTELVFGEITQRRTMKLVSQMPENGVIFSDGIQNDYLSFNSGAEAEISLAEKRGLLVQ